MPHTTLNSAAESSCQNYVDPSNSMSHTREHIGASQCRVYHHSLSRHCDHDNHLSVPLSQSPSPSHSPSSPPPPPRSLTFPYPIYLPPSSPRTVLLLYRRSFNFPLCSNPHYARPYNLVQEPFRPSPPFFDVVSFTWWMVLQPDMNSCLFICDRVPLLPAYVPVYVTSTVSTVAHLA